MALKLKKSLEIKNSIDITPLVDVVFILLIFFMVSSQFVEQPGIKLSLPKAASSRLSSQRSAVTVSLAADLRLFLGEDEVELEDLPDRLKAMMEKKSKRVLIIRADKTVPHGEVIKVMDIAKTSGVEKLVISTRTEK
ncbi:MAG: ExbD/TolR family protein [bacterium]